MRYHLNTVHYPNKYRCPFCHMSFSDSSTLKRHVLVHQEGGDFPCDICGKARAACKITIIVNYL